MSVTDWLAFLARPVSGVLTTARGAGYAAARGGASFIFSCLFLKHFSRSVFQMTLQDSAVVQHKWAADCTGVDRSVIAIESTDLKPQSKSVLNNKRAPSRRVVHRRRKRSTPTPLASATEYGTAYTVEVQKVIISLLMALRETGVSKRQFSINGPMARAVAAAFFCDMDGSDASTACRLYGVTLSIYNNIAQRVVNAGGASAVLAMAALASWRAGNVADEVGLRVHALHVIARGGMRLRSASASHSHQGHDAGVEQILLELSNIPMAVTPYLRPQPLPAAIRALPHSTLPPLTLAAELCPGGAKHCGGDLLFPLLTLTNPLLQGRMPLFVMVPGAVAAFSGSDLAHGTTEHDAPDARSPGCAAHVSFAVQTPAPTLGFSCKSEAGILLHKRLLALGATDACEGRLHPDCGTVWLAVHQTPHGCMPTTRLKYDMETMSVLSYERVVLYDAETKQPLVLYDAKGGLTGASAINARRVFGYLNDYAFTLNRQSESHAQGSLGLDGCGEQRMQMLGVRQQGYNVGTRPDKSRRWMKVANKAGDLDGYVVHWDEENCKPKTVQPVWEALAASMRSLLPSACAALSKALEDSGVRKRLYSEEASQLTSVDLTVNNVGASSAYQSPAHVDKNDRGWTLAFACKCGQCEPCA